MEEGSAGDEKVRERQGVTSPLGLLQRLCLHPTQPYSSPEGPRVPPELGQPLPEGGGGQTGFPPLLPSFPCFLIFLPTAMHW